MAVHSNKAAVDVALDSLADASVVVVKVRCARCDTDLSAVPVHSAVGDEILRECPRCDEVAESRYVELAGPFTLSGMR